MGIRSTTNGQGFGESTGESGFQPALQNSYDEPSGWNGDQTHHFAAYFQAGAAHPIASTLSPVPFGYEVYQHVYENSPMNWGDVSLGYVAQGLGQLSALGIIPNSSLGDTIRFAVCQKK